MNSRPRVLIPILLAATVSMLCASPSPAVRADPLAPLATAALSGDAAAISKLRAAGPRGLESLFTAASPLITALRNNQTRLEAPENAPLRAALDGVARQRDAYASGLYWFTDLAAAKAEAKQTGRPILSLRLLGNLDDEYSCANSRFFRTSLYANSSVSSLLRRGYVLHWKSVRPVPVLTIDMGDGRRIKRTITGNSIHYVLDSEGRVLDALPGNYGPAAFLAGLARIEKGTTGSGLDQLRRWHGRQADMLCTEWLTDALSAGVYGEEARKGMEDPKNAAALLKKLRPKAFPASRDGSPPAEEAPEAAFVRSGSGGESLSRFGAELVVQMLVDEATANEIPGFQDQKPLVADETNSPREKYFPGRARIKIEEVKPFPYPTDFDPPKGMVERPILKKAPAPAAEAALDLAKVNADASAMSLAERMTNERWAKIAVLHRDAAALTESNCRMMMAKLPETMLLPEEIKIGYTTKDSPLRRMLQNFESAIARDMVRNEYYFHTLIHQWLEEDKDGRLYNDVEALNKRVYAELFLTPDYDEWLGLVPEDTYTALEKDGCACDKGAPPMNTTKRIANP